LKSIATRFIKEYTDLQLRIGLVRWLMAFIPTTGRGQVGTALTRSFEAAIYKQYPDGSTYVGRYFEAAKKAGISPHLGIQKKPKRVPLSPRRGSSVSKRSATEDILSWASELGFLTSPSVRLTYALTKDGYVYRQLIGDSSLTAFNNGNANANPFLLPDMEKRLLFLQEICEDYVLLPLLLRLVESYSHEERFRRAGDEGKAVVRILISSFKDVHSVLIAERSLTEAKDLSNHIRNLLISIGDEKADLRVRSVKLRNVDEPSGRKASETFKMAKHRLTPRLEHLTDYGFLSPCETEEKSRDDATEFSWKVNNSGRRAAEYICALPITSIHEMNDPDRKGIRLPKIKQFVMEHAMAFFAALQVNPTDKLDRAAEDDYLKHLIWAYKRCKVSYGYSEFLGIALVAALHALEAGKRIEVADFHKFLRSDVPKNPALKESIRFAGRPEAESMHFRIMDNLLEQVR
jgi:hypothetical protein